MFILIIFFLFLLGTAFGSFFNVCISRIPRKKSIVLPASHCPFCNIDIRKSDNIPILSYLLLKGKCRNCSISIPVHYLLVEIITPLAFIGVFLLNGKLFNLLLLKYLIFTSFGIILFFIDLKHHILPDKLTLPMLGIGLIFALLPGMDISLKSALIGCLSGFLLFLALAYFVQLLTKKEALGGGDVKLIASIGIFVGIYGTIFTIVAGSVIALIILILIRHDLKRVFPFGPFLILAAMLHILAGEFFIRSYLDLFF